MSIYLYLSVCMKRKRVLVAHVRLWTSVSASVWSGGSLRRISTNRFSPDVRTRVVVGSIGGFGSQRMYSRIDILGAMFRGG